MDLGSKAPFFSLPSLAGGEVSLEAPPKGSLLILYFFDASDEAIETLIQLNEAVSRSSGALLLRAITRENAEGARELLPEERVSYSAVLIDHEGVTFAYGLTRSLPAAVTVGPGTLIGSVLGPVRTSAEIVVASADTFMSMGLPSSARKACHSMPEEWLSGGQAKLCIGYASVLMGDTDAARRNLEPSASGSASFSSEAHAALGFLEFRRGRDSDALAECGRAAGSGFADYVAGMAQARSGRCGAASVLFDKAINGTFAFGWQEALAFNAAARTAGEGGDHQAALRLYKKAFALAPLNDTIGANLMTHYWRHENVPAAVAYADLIKSIDSGSPLIQSLINEFGSELEFGKDNATLRRLKERLDGPAGTPNGILVSDLAVADCTPESNFLSVAGAGLLKRSLESAGTLVTVRRPEMLAAAEHVGISREELHDPLRLEEIARALSADLMAFGEVGNYKARYFLNLRIAEVASGEVIAVTSERFVSLEDLTPAIQKSAAALMQKVAARRGG